MHHGRHGIIARGVVQIRIVRDAELVAQFLGSDEGEQDDVGEDAAHEDADDFAVVVALRFDALGADEGGEGEAFADCAFDGGGGGGDEVAELVGCADDEGAEGAGGEFHEVDGDDAPGALHAELLEEGGGHDLVAAGEGVRVEEGAADDGDEDDAETTAEDLGGVADDCASGHGAEIRDNLSDGDGVGGEFELVL